MPSVVIDASALVELLLRTETGRRVERSIDGADLMAPDVINAEVVQVLRGLERSGKLTTTRATGAVRRLIELDVGQIPTRVLLKEVWSLRHNLSAYDACYVAVARALDCPLLTSDRPLTRAPNLDVTLICV